MKFFWSFLLLLALLAACAPRALPVAPPSATPLPPLAASSSPAAPLPTEAPLPLPSPASRVAQFPNPFQTSWQEIASGLEHPTALVFSPDSSGRLFIVEQAGRIRIWQNGQLNPEAFLDLRSLAGSDGPEQGLLGLTFHPRFASNGFFYVNFTDRGGDTHLARYSRSAENPNRADPNSRLDLLQVGQPYANHNGGSLAFGPDGFLYVGLGDGGSGGDPLGNGQSLNTLLGKLLRLDVDSASPYAIPADNPFGSEIWAYGLRNPWKFTFDPATGDLFLGDVGQGDWEEVDYLPAGSPGGANFGWSLMEGSHPFNGAPAPDQTLPVAEYSHAEGCSITGGAVYRGSLPAWQGLYLYADFCSGNIWGLLPRENAWETRLLFTTSFNISAFGQDEAGELYLADYNTGRIYRLTPNP